MVTVNVKLMDDWKLLLTSSFEDLSSDEIHKYINLEHCFDVLYFNFHNIFK